MRHTSSVSRSRLPGQLRGSGTIRLRLNYMRLSFYFSFRYILLLAVVTRLISGTKKPHKKFNLAVRWFFDSGWWVEQTFSINTASGSLIAFRCFRLVFASNFILFCLVSKNTLMRLIEIRLLIEDDIYAVRFPTFMQLKNSIRELWGVARKGAQSLRSVSVGTRFSLTTVKLKPSLVMAPSGEESGYCN